MNYDKTLTKVTLVISSSIFLLFPLLFVRGLMYPSILPRTVFGFLLIEILVGIFLIFYFKKGVFHFKTNWITFGLLGFIAVLLFTAIVGSDFSKSLWSSYQRMTGIVTFIHYFLFYFVLSSVIPKEKWTIIFRTILCSTIVLAIGSFLGKDGFSLNIFSALEQGGSFLGNTTFAGLYYVLAVAISFIGLLKEKQKNWRYVFIIGLVIISINPDLLNFAFLQGNVSIREIVNNPTLLFGEARLSTAVLWFGIPFTTLLFLIHRLIKNKGIKNIIFVVFAAVLLVAPLFVINSVVREKGFAYEFFQKQKDYPRMTVWQQGVEAYKKQPITGYGVNNFEYAFQDTFNPAIVFMSGNSWFDRPHNSIIQTAVETGALGIISIFVVIFFIFYYSFKLYNRSEEFYLVFLPFIFLLHILQTQTSFDTSASLLLIFTASAFLSAHLFTNRSVNFSDEQKNVLKYSGLAVLVAIFIFSVYLPTKHNLLMVKLVEVGDFDARTKIYDKLENAYIYPADSLRIIIENYVGAVIRSIKEIEEKGQKDKVKVELERLIALHESFLDKYEDNYRFLINYVNLIHVATIFGVDRLDKAEQLLLKAEKISQKYPQVFWLSSLNNFYQGNTTTALNTINQSINLQEQTSLPEDAPKDTGINTGFKIYQLIKSREGVGKPAFFLMTKL